MSTKRVIVSHGNCHDGVTAAVIASQKYPDADLYEAHYGDAPDFARLRGADVVFIDFCWRRNTMHEVRAVARSVLVLDHHRSARDEMLGNLDENIIDMSKWTGEITLARHHNNIAQDCIEGCEAAIYCLFDMERSGAGLAWDVLVGGPRPLFVDLIEDRDLWRFKYGRETREVHAACGSYPLTVEARRRLMERSCTELAAEGRGILRYHDKLVESAAKHAVRGTVGGHDVPTLACPNIELVSDLGNKLAKGEPFAAIWHERADGSKYYSLRSDDNGLDVSVVAASLGGGGHQRAAGFVLKPPQNHALDLYVSLTPDNPEVQPFLVSSGKPYASTEAK